jgi:hypothetical protein
MKLHDLNQVTQSRLTGGSDYMWKCWPDARFAEYEYETPDGTIYCSAVFNTLTQEVYEVNLSDGADLNLHHRWLNPLYSKAYRKEAKKRGIDADKAWDDVMWIDLPESEMLAKIAKYFTGNGEVSKDVPRVSEVEVDLTDAEILRLALQAHRRNITINQLVTEILERAIQAAEQEQENE